MSGRGKGKIGGSGGPAGNDYEFSGDSFSVNSPDGPTALANSENSQSKFSFGYNWCGTNGQGHSLKVEYDQSDKILDVTFSIAQSICGAPVKVGISGLYSFEERALAFGELKVRTGYILGKSVSSPVRGLGAVAETFLVTVVDGDGIRLELSGGLWVGTGLREEDKRITVKYGTSWNEIEKALDLTVQNATDGTSAYISMKMVDRKHIHMFPTHMGTM